MGHGPYMPTPVVGHYLSSYSICLLSQVLTFLTSYFPNPTLRHLLAFLLSFPEGLASCKNLKSEISALRTVLPLSSLRLTLMTGMEKQVPKKKLHICVKRSLVIETLQKALTDIMAPFVRFLESRRKRHMC